MPQLKPNLCTAYLLRYLIRQRLISGFETRLRIYFISRKFFGCLAETKLIIRLYIDRIYLFYSEFSEDGSIRDHSLVSLNSALLRLLILNRIPRIAIEMCGWEADILRIDSLEFRNWISVLIAVRDSGLPVRLLTETWTTVTPRAVSTLWAVIDILGNNLHSYEAACQFAPMLFRLPKPLDSFEPFVLTERDPADFSKRRTAPFLASSVLRVPAKSITINREILGQIPGDQSYPHNPALEILRIQINLDEDSDLEALGNSMRALSSLRVPLHLESFGRKPLGFREGFVEQMAEQIQTLSSKSQRIIDMAINCGVTIAKVEYSKHFNLNKVGGIEKRTKFAKSGWTYEKVADLLYELTEFRQGDEPSRFIHSELYRGAEISATVNLSHLK